MTKSDRNSPFGAEWKQFEDFFGGISALHQGKLKDLGWVDQFVKHMMKQAIPEPGTDSDSTRSSNKSSSSKSSRTSSKGSSALLQTEVFETHRNVIVKLHIPSHINPRNIQLFVNSQQLKIEGPGQNNQLVRLPSPVQSQYSKAEYRDDILQVQLRKQPKSERYDEIYIRFL
ncbi:MAG: HSP20-like chaperone protein [Paenibacillus sp.]|jgi:HSP20 family molecular chaperone IbpA|nr:HSP20-like chaperone protein [Paenibacillus sp.]